MKDENVRLNFYPQQEEFRRNLLGSAIILFDRILQCATPDAIESMGAFQKGLTRTMVQAPKESWDQQMIDDCMRLARLQREGFSEHNKAIEMATQAAIDKFVNQVGSSFDGMCAKVTNQIQGNLQRMETYVDNANNEHKERKQKESRSSLGKGLRHRSAKSEDSRSVPSNVPYDSTLEDELHTAANDESHRARAPHLRPAHRLRGN